MDHRERLLANSAREQRGLFTIAQALACGFSDRTVVARASSGMYETVHPGVYGVAGSAVTWEREVLAAVLSASDPAAASHRTAAYLLGLTSQRPPVVEVITKRHQRVKRRDFVVNESKDLIGSDIGRVDGLPVTSAVRTVVDLGASAPPRFVERCLDTGLRKRFITAWDVRCFIARVARPGRTGVGTIRPLIDERLTWQGLTESALEDVFRTLVVRATLPMPDPQHTVHDHGGSFVGRFDFAYPATKALIELDSEEFHMDPMSFQRDREKQNRVQLLGWTVYRFTWRQIVDQPERVIRTLASMCAR